MDGIQLTDVIAPAFYPVHNDLKKEGHTFYDLYGGRGSAKSSFVGVEIVLGMAKDPNAHAIIFRKYAVTLRESVFSQIQWAIDALGMTDLWTSSINPMMFTYHGNEYSQRVLFRGLDKAQKTKSLKANRGYYKYLWFEELDEFAGPEEIRTVQQSVLRGGEKFVVFKTFNPPISRSNWANEYVLEPRDDSYRHKSDYTTVPVEWLGRQFFDDAMMLKQINERAYEHEYLGEPVGLGTNVFEFLELRTITDEEIENFDRIYQGVDWGFYPDPFCFVRVHYDRNREKIYILDEIYENRLSNSQTADMIIDKGYNDYAVTCDSAENKSVGDYVDAGLHAKGARKGPRSVEYSMKWLQVRTIVIDRDRTPNAYREFTTYEFERDANNNVISRYPDKDNHSIDACRYAMNDLWYRRGSSA